jgi:hypothetical protein
MFVYYNGTVHGSRKLSEALYLHRCSQSKQVLYEFSFLSISFTTPSAFRMCSVHYILLTVLFYINRKNILGGGSIILI